MPESSVLIVGAGLAGVTAARCLQRAGVDSVVVDKGRVPGGRMATRRMGNARFDHGAQHFSVRSAEFAAEVETWIEMGLVREWYRSASITNPGRGVEPRYVGTDGMRGVVERLVHDLDVRISVAIDRLELGEGRAIATADGDIVATAATVILTPPIPQVQTLLDASDVAVPDHVHAALDKVEYDACLALMARLDGPANLPNGHLSLSDGPIAWISDNQHKGVSSTEAVTIHSTPEYAAAHLDEDPDGWVPNLITAAGQHLGGEIIETSGHRWRYAQPRNTLDIGALSFDAGAPVVLAGEAFAGARVEGAFISGVAAASIALEKLGPNR